MADCHDYKPLIAGLLDGELTAEETMAINEHLIRCASCRADYEQLRKDENKLQAVSFLEVTDEAAKSFWQLPYSRVARAAALVLIVAGYASLLAYALFAFFKDGAEAVVSKISAAAILIGFLVLLAMVALHRVQTYRVDPYKEIER